MEESVIKWETGIQLLARLGSRDYLANLDPVIFPNLHPKQVVEVYGKAGSGKTEILYHFISQCILPKSWNGIILNGIDCNVLLIDNDYHFNLLRLVTLIEKRIRRENSKRHDVINLHDDNVLSFVKERLQKLYILKCSNSEQFLITLCSLEKLLTENDISIIFVDSISAFYWLDRMNFMDNYKKLEDYYGSMVMTLKRLVNDYNLILIATKQALMKNTEPESMANKNAPPNITFDFMGKQWKKFVDYYLFLKNNVEDNKSLLSISVINENTQINLNAKITDCGLEYM
ncbi:DNA repair protein XRCC2-like [Centruroides vittatus]|uniref:DNA repair protein XRCC2-like n=1 Tax=Centruroides vittatus TaxID=120091 RepID=UPI0035108186